MLFRKHFVHHILFFFFFLTHTSLTATPYSESYEEIVGHVHPKKGQLSPAFSAANAAALHWLNLIDNHQYGPSWLDAGKFLKEVVTKDQWIAAMNGTHRPFGQETTRELEDLRQVSTLPFGTQGGFIIITFRTEFNHKRPVREMVVLMQDARLPAWEMTSWGVIHYQIGFPEQ